jgi:hypothetical protein
MGEAEEKGDAAVGFEDLKISSEFQGRAAAPPAGDPGTADRSDATGE